MLTPIASQHQVKRQASLSPLSQLCVEATVTAPAGDSYGLRACATGDRATTLISRIEDRCNAAPISNVSHAADWTLVYQNASLTALSQDTNDQSFLACLKNEDTIFQGRSLSRGAVIAMVAGIGISLVCLGLILLHRAVKKLRAVPTSGVITYSESYAIPGIDLQTLQADGRRRDSCSTLPPYQV